MYFLKLIWQNTFSLVFRITLLGCVLPARLGWKGPVKWYMRLNARIILFLMRGKEKQSVKEIGEEWRRMFPKEKYQEFLRVENDTYYARTHVWCPLRGTGNTAACHYLMEFDRTMVDAFGGQFIVLKCQAQPGLKTCDIAIRRKGAAVDDLVPAYRES